jgi:hypothetical protein
VNEEDCARVVFWSGLKILDGFKKWGCDGCFMRGIRDLGVCNDSCQGMGVDESAGGSGWWGSGCS